MAVAEQPEVLTPPRMTADKVREARWRLIQATLNASVGTLCAVVGQPSFARSLFERMLPLVRNLNRKVILFRRRMSRGRTDLLFYLTRSGWKKKLVTGTNYYKRMSQRKRWRDMVRRLTQVSISRTADPYLHWREEIEPYRRTRRDSFSAVLWFRTSRSGSSFWREIDVLSPLIRGDTPLVIVGVESHAGHRLVTELAERGWSGTHYVVPDLAIFQRSPF